MRRRFLKEQGGFTLPEMMVTMMIMIVVLFSLYSIFDMSIKVFKFGNDKVEAVENARLGLEKMEREIRAAYPVKGPTSTGAQRYRFFDANGVALTSPSAIVLPRPSLAYQITFGNELGSAGNGKIDCNPSGAAPGGAGYSPCEYITYKLSGSTLMRNNTASGSTSGTGDQPVVEFVKPNGLQFKYFSGTTCKDASGNNTVAVGAEINPASPGYCTQADIARVEISLQIVKDKGTQTLATEVNLRNPGKFQ